MAAPKADPARCDVLGCGIPADRCTEGNEKDVQGLDRKPVVGVNTCPHHENWPFSNDAQMFALGDVYRNRKVKV